AELVFSLGDRRPLFFFFSSRRRHTRLQGDWSSDVCSSDLRFEACWSDEQWAMHLEAARHTRSAFDVAFGFITERVRAGRPPRERSEERRVGKECRWRGSPCAERKRRTMGWEAGDDPNRLSM